MYEANPHNQPETDTIMFPLIQKRKLRHGEIKQIAYSWDLIPENLVPESELLTSTTMQSQL